MRHCLTLNACPLLNLKSTSLSFRTYWPIPTILQLSKWSSSWRAVCISRSLPRAWKRRRNMTSWCGMAVALIKVICLACRCRRMRSMNYCVTQMCRVIHAMTERFLTSIQDGTADVKQVQLPLIDDIRNRLTGGALTLARMVSMASTQRQQLLSVPVTQVQHLAVRCCDAV